MQVNNRTHFMKQAMFASIDNYHKIHKIQNQTQGEYFATSSVASSCF